MEFFNLILIVLIEIIILIELILNKCQFYIIIYNCLVVYILKLVFFFFFKCLYLFNYILIYFDLIFITNQLKCKVNSATLVLF